jgi:hypothetical protein
MTILLCGHSLGSVISNVLNTKYPSDADAMLLTGFAPILPTNEIGLAAQALLFPADISAPQYAKLPEIMQTRYWLLLVVMIPSSAHC